MQSTCGMQGRRSTPIVVEHQSAMPFHVRDDACGNAPVNEDEIHWNAESPTFAISLYALMGASVKTIRLSGTITNEKIGRAHV